MTSRVALAIMLIASLGVALVDTLAAETQVVRQDLKLSPELLKLLRAEMGEIAGGVQGIALSLAIADWRSIQETSEKIRASYIMERKLTPAQAEELERVLPEHFKELDSEFHQKAGELGQAAAAHDPELIVFHYSRLIESCVPCHASYARSRFPGFAAAKQRSPGH
jgi:cytochrome c556